MSLTDVDYTQIPAGDPPDNVDPNFIDPPSRAWQPRLAVYITLPIAVLSIFLRVYTRIHRAHRFQAEDCKLVRYFGPDKVYANTWQTSSSQPG